MENTTKKFLLLWPMLVLAAAIVFGAGQLTEQIQNGKYVRNEVFLKHCEAQADAIAEINNNLGHLRANQEAIYKEVGNVSGKLDATIEILHGD